MKAILAVWLMDTGDPIDLDNNLWRDISSSGNDATISGEGIGIFNDNTDETAELYLNGEQVIYGTTDTTIVFEPLVSPEHTVFNLCKYREDSENKHRIIQTNSYNGILVSGLADQVCFFCFYIHIYPMIILSKTQNYIKQYTYRSGMGRSKWK